MKKDILLVLIFALISFYSLAQKITATGFYINSDNDTIWTTFFIPFNKMEKHPKITSLQKSATILDNSKKKRTITPEIAREINFNCNNISYKFISVSNDTLGWKSEKTKNIFLREEVSNDCKVYTYIREEIKSVPTIQRDYYSMGLNQGDAIIGGSKDLLSYTKDVLLYKCDDSNVFKKPKHKQK